MSEVIYTPEYAEGAQDYRAGLSLSDNLYPDNPASAALWEKGFRDAEAEDYRDIFDVHYEDAVA